MKKNVDKRVLYFFTLCVLILIPLIQNISFLLQIYGYINDYKFINPAIILFGIIPFLIFLYIRNLKKNNFKLDIYDYLLFIFIIIGIIVSLFSVDIYTSFFGRDNRHDGFLSVLCYNLLLINWKRLGTEEDLKIWYKIIILIAIFNVAYSLLQIYTDYTFIARTSINMTASGFCGHNNFFGSLIVTALSIISCKFLCDKKHNCKDALVIIFLLMGLVNSQSSGPFLAYIVTFIFIVIFLKIKKSLLLKNVLILVLLIPIMVIGINTLNNVVFQSEVCELCDVKANVIDNGGHDRWKIWKRTFSVIQKHPIIGVGYDNLAYVYPNPYSNVKVEPSGITITDRQPGDRYYLVDNAHNVYLQILVCSGIVGLIPYLLLCLFIFIKGCKSNKKILFMFIAGFVAYSVQAFFNINVITVAPIYYLIMGLILIDSNEVDKIEDY